MQLGTGGSKFQHVTEYCNTPTTVSYFCLTEQSNRGAHRGGVGIVAFINQQDGPAGHREQGSRSTSARGFEIVESKRGQREISSDKRRGGQHR